MVHSTPPVVELTATRGKMVVTSEKSVLVTPGTLVTVHAAPKNRTQQHFTTQKAIFIKQTQCFSKRGTRARSPSDLAPIQCFNWREEKTSHGLLWLGLPFHFFPQKDGSVFC